MIATALERKIDPDVLIREVTFSAVRSSGKGGQNVNKVSTKVELRWNLNRTSYFNPEEQARLTHSPKITPYLSMTGEIIITNEETRSQTQNKEKAFERFLEILEEALIVPKERRATKPSRAQRAGRLKDKRNRSERKQSRRGNFE